MLRFGAVGLPALTGEMIPSFGAGQTATGDDEMVSDPVSDLASILVSILVSTL